MGVLFLASATALGTGCSADKESEPASGDDPQCESTDGIMCAPQDLSGFPFVQFAVSYTLDCAPCARSMAAAGESTLTMRQPEPGRLCMSGRVEADDMAGFNLQFADRTADNKIIKPFDPAKIGATHATLMLESPPSTGIDVGLFTLKQLDCTSNNLECDESHSVGNFGAGQVTVNLSDFPSQAAPSAPLEMNQLDALLFHVGPGDYDFCISAFKMLDAQGAEVEP